MWIEATSNAFGGVQLSIDDPITWFDYEILEGIIGNNTCWEPAQVSSELDRKETIHEITLKNTK